MAGVFLAHYNVLVHICITNYVWMLNTNDYANINISAIKSLGLYARKQHKPWFVVFVLYFIIFVEEC